MGKLRAVLTVLHTSPVLQPGAGEAGGLNVYLLNSARHLAALGHDITLVTRKDRPGLPDREELGPGLSIVYLPAGPEEAVPKSEAEDLIAPFTEALDAWWQPADVIHSHHWFAGVAALPVAKKHQVPHIQSYHSVAAPLGDELGAGEQPESAGRPAGERLIALESDRIIAVSRFEQDTIIERYGADPDRFAIVHPATDTDVFRPITPSTDPYLVFAGRLQPLKGADLAIRALAEIPAAMRPRLIIAGEPASGFLDYAEELRRLVAELGLESYVDYRGSMPRHELAELIGRAQILLNPSHSETYGIINLEAAACGTPVIASRVGGMVDSVRDGQTGYLIPSRDPAEWAQAMTRIISDKTLRSSLGTASREFAESRGWREAAQELADVYQGEA